MNIAYTCFEISSMCNMDCKFCFSCWRELKQQISTEKAKHIIDVLVNCGLKAINLTGGDPLVREDIIEIAKYCKQKGLMTIISTNGILLPQKKEILEHIDAINLPLDSFSPSLHNKMRPCAMDNHHAHILWLIDYISQNHKNVKIKINTMVGKTNIDDIPNMLEIMNNKVLSWKLGKFFDSGYGKNYADQFSIDENSYKQLVSFVEKNYKKSTIVDEDFNIGEDYDVFIDGCGNICEVTENGVKNRGDIDNLPNLHTRTGKDGLWGEYLEKVYDYKEKK